MNTEMINREDLDTTDFSDVVTGNLLACPTPGEILLEDYLKPMNVSQYKLAQERLKDVIPGIQQYSEGFNENREWHFSLV